MTETPDGTPAPPPGDYWTSTGEESPVLVPAPEGDGVVVAPNTEEDDDE